MEFVGALVVEAGVVVGFAVGDFVGPSIVGTGIGV